MPAMTVEEEKIVEDMREFFNSGKDANMPVFTRMTKCEQYAVGNQWDKKVLSANEARRKFSLTINEILPIVNHLSGFQAKNPSDIKARNIRGGSAKGAQIVTALTKHAFDNSDGARVENQVFEDGIRSGRGFLELDIDYSDDPLNGQVVVNKLDPFMVIPDGGCNKYDYNKPKDGAKYIIIEEWIDQERIDAKYPDKAEYLSSDSTLSYRQGFYKKLVNYFFRDKPSTERDTYRQGDIELDRPDVDRRKFQYRVTRIWWRKWVKGAILQKSENPLDYMVLYNEKDIKYARKLLESAPAQGVKLIEKDKNGKPLVVPVLHKTVLVGDVLLEHIENPFNGMMLLPVFRYSPYHVNGYEFGIVQNLLGPQDQVNWSWSMELNLIKQLANAGWKIVKDKTGKFTNWLKAHGGEDGVVIEESLGGGKVDKLEPNNFPAGYDLITEKGKTHMREISQVRLEFPEPGKQESGKAIMLKQQNQITASSNMFSNWDYTLRLMGTCLMQIILMTDIYSEAEIREIVDDEDLIDPDMLAEAQEMAAIQLEEAGIPRIPQPQSNGAEIELVPEPQRLAYLQTIQGEMAVYQQYLAEMNKIARPIAEAMLLDEIRTLKFSKYSIKTELAAHAETYRMAKSFETFELHKTLVESGQPGVSRRQLIDATDVPNKEEIINDVPQAVGAR